MDVRYVHAIKKACGGLNGKRRISLTTRSRISGESTYFSNLLSESLVLRRPQSVLLLDSIIRDANVTISLHFGNSTHCLRRTVKLHALLQCCGRVHSFYCSEHQFYFFASSPLRADFRIDFFISICHAAPFRSCLSYHIGIGRCTSVCMFR